jgi:hypothetical protein
LQVFEKVAPGADFGGRSVLAFGDLLQLRPVNREFIFRKIDWQTMVSKFGGVLAAPRLFEQFRYSELQINQRHKEDPAYADLLSRARLGNLTSSDEQLLATRVITAASPDGQTKLPPAARPKGPPSLDAAVDTFLQIGLCGCVAVGVG